jgi:hypothetical protein
MRVVDIVNFGNFCSHQCPRVYDGKFISILSSDMEEAIKVN